MWVSGGGFVVDDEDDDDDDCVVCVDGVPGRLPVLRKLPL